MAYKYLFESLLSILLSIYVGIELGILCLALWGTTKLLKTWLFKNELFFMYSEIDCKWTFAFSFGAVVFHWEDLVVLTWDSWTDPLYYIEHSIRCIYIILLNQSKRIVSLTFEDISVKWFMRLLMSGYPTLCVCLSKNWFIFTN